MLISFEGIGREIVTAKKTSTLRKGDLCYFSASDTVAPATAASGFHGKVVAVYDDGTAGVQIRGYVEMTYAPSAPITGVGRKGLAVTNATTVHQDSDAEEYLVIHNDPTKRIVGIML